MSQYFQMPKAHNYLFEIENYVPGKAKIADKNQKIIIWGYKNKLVQT